MKYQQKKNGINKFLYVYFIIIINYKFSNHYFYKIYIYSLHTIEIIEKFVTQTTLNGLAPFKQEN